MPRTLEQPAEPAAAPSSLPQGSVTSSLPELPPDFDDLSRAEFLRNFLNPDIDHFRLAELFGLRLSQLHTYINSDEFQQRLADQTSIAEVRATACAKMAQPRAVAALEHIIDTYSEAERNQPVGRDPIPLRLRQQHRETARRASWLILRMTGAIPVHVRAAKPARENTPPADDLCRRESLSIPRKRKSTLRPGTAREAPHPDASPEIPEPHQPHESPEAPETHQTHEAHHLSLPHEAPLAHPPHQTPARHPPTNPILPRSDPKNNSPPPEPP